MAKKVKSVKKRPATKKKFVAIAIAATAIASAVGWWTIGNHKVQVSSYFAKEIVDGDTFITKEDQIIRIASINAPEIEGCGGKEAKKELIELISGKPLYLKVVFRDIYNRLVADVYAPEGSVAEKLLDSGWVYYYRRTAAESDQMKMIGERVRKSKIGIYSSKCTQIKNIENPRCVIKANNAIGNKNKQYRFPGCGQYTNTSVQLYMGDEWFCTETEAKKAGYTKGSDCFGKIWPQPVK